MSTDPAATGGISISGSQFSGQIAQHVTGDVVQHNVTSAAGTDVGKLLDEMERLLAAHRDEIPEHDKAQRDVNDARQESARGKDADRDRIMDALSRLAKRVGSVAVLAEAAEKLRSALGGIF